MFIYFPKIDLHVEIAGLRSKSYIDKMELKKSLGAMIIWSRDNYDAAINDIVERHK